MTAPSTALSTGDRIDIAELVARFAHCSDYGDWDSLAGCFTDEVVTFISGSPTYVGIAAQVEHARKSDEWTEGQNRHLALNLWIESDGADAARARYYLINFVAGKELFAAKVVLSARMTDHVVRTVAGWRIARRELEPDQPFVAPDTDAGAT